MVMSGKQEVVTSVRTPHKSICGPFQGFAQHPHEPINGPYQGPNQTPTQSHQRPFSRPARQVSLYRPITSQFIPKVRLASVSEKGR